MLLLIENQSLPVLLCKVLQSLKSNW